MDIKPLINFTWVLIVGFFLSIPISANYTYSEKTPIGPGVVHYSMIDKNIPLAVQVIEVNLEDPLVTLEMVLSNNTLQNNETLISMSHRLNRKKHWVLGGINADFWGGDTTPNGIVVQDNNLLKSANRRCAFILTQDKKPLMDVIENNFKLTTSEGNIIEFNNYNGSIDQINPVLRSPDRMKTVEIPFGHYGFLLMPDYWVLEPEGKLKVRILKFFDDGQTLSLNEGQFGLIIPIEKLPPESLGLGDSLDLEIQTQGKNIGQIDNLTLAVGGGPRLLKDGEKIVIGEGERKYPKSFIENRHPRTAIGFSKDEKTLYMVVVDGRQAGYSIGINLPDLAQLMLSLGSYHAMNLDGGGSSTMVVRGETANRTSDSGGDRAVTNAIFAISSAPRGGPRYFDAVPYKSILMTGQKLKLEVNAKDRYYNEIEIPREVIYWQVSEGKGEINQEGLFSAGKKSGTVRGDLNIQGLVGASFNQLQTQAWIEVILPEKIRIVPVPEKVALFPGEELQLHLEGLTPGGEWLEIDTETAKWNLKGKNLASINQSGKLIANKIGKGEVKVRFGKLRAEVPFLVGERRTELIEDGSDASEWSLKGLRISEEKCSLTSSDEQVAEGSSALRFQYDLTGQKGTAAVYLKFEQALKEDPRSLSFQLYGNGCDHLFRVVIKDTDGEFFYADAPGSITWRDEWKKVEVPFKKLTAHWKNPTGIPNGPYTLSEFYLVEQREAKKSWGVLYLDDFQIEYAPN